MDELISFEDNKFDVPFTYEIFVPSKANIDENTAISNALQLVPTTKTSFEQEDVIDTKFEEGVVETDKIDYLIAATSGLLTAALNILWNGELSLVDAQEWGKKEINNFVLNVAKSQGYKVNDLSEAISKLENDFRIPSDKIASDFGGGLQHHLRDFAHHPTPVGLAFNLLSQFTSMGYGTNTLGEFISVKIIDDEFIGKNIFEKLYNGLVNWAFHLVSDMAGSNQYAGLGTGIPGHLLSLLKEISTLPLIKDITMKYKDDDIGFSVWISKLYNGTYFHRGVNGEKIRFDLRTEIGLSHQLLNQAIPVIANECIVRGFYFLRRLYLEAKNKDVRTVADIKKLEPSNYLPFNNKTVTRMITVSSGVFMMVTTSSAVVKAAIKNRGIKGDFSKDFILNINYAGIGHFVIACVADEKYIVKDLKKIYQAYIDKNKTTEQYAIDFRAFEYLSLTEKQARLLDSLMYQKVLYDIQNTKDEKQVSLKRMWLSEWESTSVKEAGLYDYIYLIKDEDSLYESIQHELASNADLGWIYLVSMELALFYPYFSLNSDNGKEYKGLKKKSDYEKDRFVVLQPAVASKDYDQIMQAYNRNIGILKNQTQKTFIAVSATFAASIATGGLALAFAPQIAILIAGNTVAGLYGAALTNASLAIVGGGSLAVGGLGMAGGTAIIAGGGTLLGVVGSGAASLSSLILISSKDYILNECAKLLTYCEQVIINNQKGPDAVRSIQACIAKGIDELKQEITKIEAADVNKDNSQKKMAKDCKISLSYLSICNKQLLKCLKDT